MTPDGHAKILDFGLAKLLEPPKEGAPDGISHMETLAKTQAGFVLGTLRYMSPEQARGQAVDSRSDIFSLGIVLYEMVTGQLPFSGASPLDTLHAIAFEETRPITAVRPNLPPVAPADRHALPQEARPATATPTPRSSRRTSRPCSARSRAASRARHRSRCGCRSAGARSRTARSASGCCRP